MECPEAIKFQVVGKARDYFRGKYDLIDTDGGAPHLPGRLGAGAGLQYPAGAGALRFEAESQERLDEIRAIIEEPLRTWIKEMG